MERDFDFRPIALELIDPPELAMRADMDDDKLAELAADIKRNGVIQPLGVYQVGDRFRIIYGHRRYVASTIAGERLLPCRVHANGDVHEEDYKLAENRFREDVNPVDEATWFADLLERRYGGDFLKLCAGVNATESYVNGRLDLLRGDDEVRDALRQGKINLAVARELNRFLEEDWRRFYLVDAIKMGATAAVVNGWRLERQKIARLQELDAEHKPDAGAVSTAISITTVDSCVLCWLADDPLEMEYVRVHKSCLTTAIREARAAAMRQS